MRYRVKLFAGLREATGRSVWELETECRVRGSWLLAQFFTSFPEVADLRTSTRLAVNKAFRDSDTLLTEEDEIALIPPVSGG